MKFNDLNLNQKIVEALSKIGFDEVTEIQEKTIPIILGGSDMVARSQTGSGKTLAFGLPIINNIMMDIDGVQALIVCPTRELAMQVSTELRKATLYLENIKIVPVYGGADISRQIQSLKRGAKIVVGTPGRIIDHLNRRTLKLHNIKTLVLDEADEMLNMGFKDDIEIILKATPIKRQTLMFSATFPPAIKAITKNYQNNPVSIELGELNKSLNNVNQSFAFADRGKKTQVMLEIFKSNKPSLSIIFSNTKKNAEQLKDILVNEGFNAVTLHGDMRQRERTKVLSLIKNNSKNILVATDVAARGIDIDDIDYIINYDIPNNVESYLHRIGRTARAGKTGNAITIISSRDQYRILKDFERETKSNIKEMPEHAMRLNKEEDFKASASGAKSFNYYKKPGGKRSFGSFDKNKKDAKKNSDHKPGDKSFDNKGGFKNKFSDKNKNFNKQPQKT